MSIRETEGYGVNSVPIRVVLALFDMDVKHFAELAGYDAGYVSNILTGQTIASDRFRDAVAATIDELVFGPRNGQGSR